jgi:hypothetical protein
VDPIRQVGIEAKERRVFVLPAVGLGMCEMRETVVALEYKEEQKGKWLGQEQNTPK